MTFPGPASDGGFLTRDLPPIPQIQGNERLVVDTMLGAGLDPTQAWITVAQLVGSRGNNVTVTTNYAMGALDGLIRVDCSAQSVVVTLLPLALTFVGQDVVVKRIDNSFNALTVTGDGLIDGNASIGLVQQYQAYRFRSNGTNWDIVG